MIEFLNWWTQDNWHGAFGLLIFFSILAVIYDAIIHICNAIASRGRK